MYTNKKRMDPISPLSEMVKSLFLFFWIDTVNLNVIIFCFFTKNQSPFLKKKMCFHYFYKKLICDKTPAFLLKHHKSAFCKNRRITSQHLKYIRVQIIRLTRQKITFPMKIALFYDKLANVNTWCGIPNSSATFLGVLSPNFSCMFLGPQKPFLAIAGVRFAFFRGLRAGSLAHRRMRTMDGDTSTLLVAFLLVLTI